MPTAWLESPRLETAPFIGSPTVRPSGTRYSGTGPTIRLSAAMHDTRETVVGVVGGEEPNIVSSTQELLCEGLYVAADSARIRVRVRGDEPNAHRAIVEHRSDAPHFVHQVSQRNFVKFTFIRVLPEWRRRSPEQRAQDKREFAAACADFAEDHLCARTRSWARAATAT